MVLKRSIYRGHVRWTFPHRYVGDWDGRLGIYCGPGNQGKVMRRGPDGYLKRWVTDAPPYSTTWQRTHVLRFEQRVPRTRSSATGTSSGSSSAGTSTCRLRSP